MKRFEVMLARDRREYAYVTVEAESAEEAQAKAVKAAENDKLDSGWDSDNFATDIEAVHERRLADD